MQFKITRDSTHDVLSHATEGKERKNHKYIARVLVSRNKKKNRYRYFYDKEEYQAYLKNRKNKEVNKNFKKTKSSVTNFFKKIKDNAEKTSDKIDNIIANGKNFTKSFLKKNSAKKVSEVKKSSYEKSSDKSDLIAFLTGGLIGYGIKKFLDKDSDDIYEDLISKKEKEKKPKYIAKVKLPNGKYRYFYTQDEYDAYQKRLEYQKNEPDFMKHVRDISENNVYTALEDMEKINEKYSPYSESSSTNCCNCSAAYELRRRGYDVEAKLADSSYNGSSSRFYDYFEDAKVLAVYGDGSTMTHNEKALKKISDGKFNVFDVWKNESDYDFYTSNQSYTPKSIEKAIKNNNPPGSRGMIDVYWKKGGAHSIVYEVNNKGNVVIRDSQTYDEYSLDELADRVKRVQIVRTDNLQVKKDILNAVETNEDKERRYYVDNGYLKNYE